MNRNDFLYQWLDFPRYRYDLDFIYLQSKPVFVGPVRTGVLASLWENCALVSSIEVSTPVRVTPESMRNRLFPSFIDRI